MTPWTKHYYPSLCGHCHQPGSVSSPLKRCGGCQSFYYCSREHQQLARRDHKTLCQFIAKKKKEGTPLFEGHTGKPRFEMLKKLHSEMQIYSLLHQKVEPIFLNPPVCRKTDCLAPLGEGGLVSCPDCQSVSWCSSLHRAEAEQHHSQFCQDLKLARVADSLENIHGLHFHLPAIPFDTKPVYEAGPQNMVDHLSRRVCALITILGSRGGAKDYGVKDCDNGILQFIFTSDLLSGPLTLFEAARRTLPDLADKESLQVHIAGADGYDLFCVEKWDYLADSLLPALKRLDIRFIGPNIPGGNNNNVKTSDHSSKLGRAVSHGFYKMPYQQFRQREDFSTPDLVLVQNCGFTQFKTSSFGWILGWEEGLKSLLHRSGAPVIFTSLSKADAQRDLKRFQEFCGQKVEVLVQAEENKMRSYRPNRGIGFEDEMDLSYFNYYINIVRVK